MRDWQHLQTLLAFAENKTLARAAEHLEIDRSTVSRRIENLEKELRVTLVERMGRDLVLTDAGHQAVRAAETMRARTHALAREIGGRDEAIEGTVRLTTTPKLANVLSADLTAYLDAYPKVVLEVSATNTAVDLSMVEADVALRLTTAPPEDLVGRRIASPASARYAEEGLAERLETLSSVPCVGWGFEEAILTWLRAWLNQPVYTVASSNDMDLVKAMVSEGAGVALLPCYCVDVERDGLVQLSPSFAEGMPALWLLYRPALRSVARVRSLVSHLKDSLPRHASRFAGQAPTTEVEQRPGPSLLRVG